MPSDPKLLLWQTKYSNDELHKLYHIFKQVRNSKILDKKITIQRVMSRNISDYFQGLRPLLFSVADL